MRGVLLAKSVNSVNLGSSIKIFEEPAPLTKKLIFTDDNENGMNEVNGNCPNNVEKDSLVEKKADNCPTVVDDGNDKYV